MSHVEGAGQVIKVADVVVTADQQDGNSWNAGVEGAGQGVACGDRERKASCCAACRRVRHMQGKITGKAGAETRVAESVKACTGRKWNKCAQGRVAADTLRKIE
jgi:hypothetical protein